MRATKIYEMSLYLFKNNCWNSFQISIFDTNSDVAQGIFKTGCLPQKLLNYFLTKLPGVKKKLTQWNLWKYWSFDRGRCTFSPYVIKEHFKLKGTHKGHQDQLLSEWSTGTQTYNLAVISTVL